MLFSRAKTRGPLPPLPTAAGCYSSQCSPPEAILACCHMLSSLQLHQVSLEGGNFLPKSHETDEVQRLLMRAIRVYTAVQLV